METNNENENGQQTVDQNVLEDVFLAVEIVKKALEFRSYITEGVLGEKFLNLPEKERISEMLNPKISFFFVDEERKIPALFFRFVGDDSPLVEACFYPFEAVLTFLKEARYNVGRINPNDRTEKEKEDLVFNHTLDMTLLLFDNFYRRAEIMMNYVTLEVIGQWHRNKLQEWLHTESERGNKLAPQKDIRLDSCISAYHKEISNLWKYQGQTRDNWRKLQLAEEYESLYKHWGWLLKMSNDETTDWRDYAKAGKYEDTPDDLLNKLGNVERLNEEATTTKLSEIAIEHAARRVGLIKKSGFSEYAQDKRKEGIKVSDYSSQQLLGLTQLGEANNADSTNRL